MAVFGYARVSSKEQNLERQIQQLKAEGIEERNIIKDKQSGKDFNRPGFNMLVGTDLTAPLLRSGDLLVVISLDRLGRNYEEIIEQWKNITNKLKADIRVLDMPILDTTQNDGLDRKFLCDIVLQLLSYVAERERNEIKERQRQGIDVMPIINGKRVSLKTGRATGRPEVEYPKNWTEVYNKWQSGNITATQAIQDLKLKRTTFYRLVNKYKSVTT